jgi:hypothetical protein
MIRGGFSGRQEPLGLAADARVTGRDSRVAEAGFQNVSQNLRHREMRSWTRRWIAT